jgi:hypothetical protein
MKESQKDGPADGGEIAMLSTIVMQCPLVTAKQLAYMHWQLQGFKHIDVEVVDVHPLSTSQWCAS